MYACRKLTKISKSGRMETRQGRRSEAGITMVMEAANGAAHNVPADPRNQVAGQHVGRRDGPTARTAARIAKINSIGITRIRIGFSTSRWDGRVLDVVTEALLRFTPTTLKITHVMRAEHGPERRARFAGNGKSGMISKMLLNRMKKKSVEQVRQGSRGPRRPSSLHDDLVTDEVDPRFCDGLRLSTRIFRFRTARKKIVSVMIVARENTTARSCSDRAAHVEPQTE